MKRHRSWLAAERFITSIIVAEDFLVYSGLSRVAKEIVALASRLITLILTIHGIVKKHVPWTLSYQANSIHYIRDIYSSGAIYIAAERFIASKILFG